MPVSGCRERMMKNYNSISQVWVLVVLKNFRVEQKERRRRILAIARDGDWHLAPTQIWIKLLGKQNYREAQTRQGEGVCWPLREDGDWLLILTQFWIELLGKHLSLSDIYFFFGQGNLSIPKGNCTTINKTVQQQERLTRYFKSTKEQNTGYKRFSDTVQVLIS